MLFRRLWTQTSCLLLLFRFVSMYANRIVEYIYSETGPLWNIKLYKCMGKCLVRYSASLSAKSNRLDILNGLVLFFFSCVWLPFLDPLLLPLDLVVCMRYVRFADTHTYCINGRVFSVIPIGSTFTALKQILCATRPMCIGIFGIWMWKSVCLRWFACCQC